MIEGMGSHLPPLLAAISATPGLPVLEIGAGRYSTPCIHSVAVPAGRKVTTIETVAEWMANFTYLAGPLHEFLPQTDDLIDELAKQRWGAVFIDDMGGHLRIKRLASFFDTADFIVMHDYDYPATKESLDGWLENVPHQKLVYTLYHPHTLVVSKNRSMGDLAL